MRLPRKYKFWFLASNGLSVAGFWCTDAGRNYAWRAHVMPFLCIPRGWRLRPPEPYCLWLRTNYPRGTTLSPGSIRWINVESQIIIAKENWVLDSNGALFFPAYHANKIVIIYYQRKTTTHENLWGPPQREKHDIVVCWSLWTST